MSAGLGRKLKELRKNKKLTEEQMAKLLGVSIEAYKEFETGEQEPSVKRLYILADFFNVSITVLFEYEE